MLKAVISCLLITLISASQPDWIGEWYVLNRTSDNLGFCGTPQNGTFVNISSVAPGNLSLSGYNDFDNQTEIWWLEWNSSSQSSSFCSNNSCTSGFFETEQGIAYANITWNVSSSGGVHQCSVVLTPADLTWVGKWYVVFAGSNSLYECDVPKSKLWVNITLSYYGTPLEMDGTDQFNDPMLWILNWQPNQVSAQNACTGVLCANANLLMIDTGILCGVINWNITGSTYYCRTKLCKNPLSTDAENFVLNVDTALTGSDVFRSAEPWLQ